MFIYIYYVYTYKVHVYVEHYQCATEPHLLSWKTSGAFFLWETSANRWCHCTRRVWQIQICCQVWPSQWAPPCSLSNGKHPIKSSERSEWVSTVIFQLQSRLLKRQLNTIVVVRWKQLTDNFCNIIWGCWIQFCVFTVKNHAEIESHVEKIFCQVIYVNSS